MRRGSESGDGGKVAGPSVHGVPRPSGPPVFTNALLRPVKLADQLYEQILRQIIAGQLPEGSRLPAESRLARDFAVSRPVVREALSRLRADGMIISQHGSGSYVQRRPSKALLSLAPIGGIADLMRCFELRIAIEGDAAWLAAARRDGKDLKVIDEALQALARAVDAGELGVEPDIRFHNAVARATKNQLFETVMEALATRTLHGVTVTRKLSLSIGRARLEKVQSEHELILKAIREGHPEAARSAMRNHIDNARNRVLAESA